MTFFMRWMSHKQWKPCLSVEPNNCSRLGWVVILNLTIKIQISFLSNIFFATKVVLIQYVSPKTMLWFTLSCNSETTKAALHYKHNQIFHTSTSVILLVGRVQKNTNETQEFSTGETMKLTIKNHLPWKLTQWP